MIPDAIKAFILIDKFVNIEMVENVFRIGVSYSRFLFIKQSISRLKHHVKYYYNIKAAQNDKLV